MARALPLLRQVLLEADPDGEVADAVAALAEAYPKTPRFRKPINWVGPVVIVSTIAVLAGGVVWYSIHLDQQQRAEAERRSAYAAPFQARLKEYLPNALQRDIQPPYRRGMVMTINLAGKGIDGMLLDLPPGLRPDKPDDVGTILWLQWGKDVVGYTNGVDAFVITCDATLIDKSKDHHRGTAFCRRGQPTRRNHNDPNTGASPTPTSSTGARLPVK